MKLNGIEKDWYPRRGRGRGVKTSEQYTRVTFEREKELIGTALFSVLSSI